jgi:hypothetical protein
MTRIGSTVGLVYAAKDSYSSENMQQEFSANTMADER